MGIKCLKTTESEIWLTKLDLRSGRDHREEPMRQRLRGSSGQCVFKTLALAVLEIMVIQI